MTFDYDAFMRKQEELRIEAERHQRKKKQDRLKRIETIETPEGTVITIDGYPMRLQRDTRIGIEDIERVESVLAEAGIKGNLFDLTDNDPIEYAYYHPDSLLLFEQDTHLSERVIPFRYEPERIIGLWDGEWVNDLLPMLVQHLRAIVNSEHANFEGLLFYSVISLQARRFDEKTHKDYRVGLTETRRIHFYIDRQGRGLFITPEGAYNRNINHAAFIKGNALLTANREESLTLLSILHACCGTKYILNNENGWVTDFLDNITVITTIDMAVSMFNTKEL